MNEKIPPPVGAVKTYSPSLLDHFIVLLAVPFIHLLGLTLRIREEGRTELGPRAKQTTPPIWVLWHETILMSVWHHRGQDVHVMISASRDGELISRVARSFGYVPVRGSSSRGGRQALQEMIDRQKAGKRCAITPDGPRGPRRQMKMGAVELARATGSPIVPFGFAAKGCWRLKSWDRFIIPKPFTQAVFVYGEPIEVPHQGGGDQEYLQRVQKELERVIAVAENRFSNYR